MAYQRDTRFDRLRVLAQQLDEFQRSLSLPN